MGEEAGQRRRDFRSVLKEGVSKEVPFEHTMPPVSVLFLIVMLFPNISVFVKFFHIVPF